MNVPPVRSSKPLADRLLGDLFPWAIALATGLDYFDNSVFAFFTSYIAGGVNASPDELVWASSAYAVASVLGILQQQWWIERLGNRRYIAGCLFLFAAGAVAATLAESSVELALARGFQGYFIGPMMSAARILIQTRFTPQERPVATRRFLNMILLGTALAPLCGGYLVAWVGWRALFSSTAFAGMALGVLAFVAVPSTGRVHPEERSDTHFWPYLIFAFAQGALQIVMQQVRFQLFSTSPELIVLTAAGLLSLGWFAWHQWHHPKPLLRLHALREKTFQVGIALYIAFYYINNAMSFLVSRLLEGGLNYPVENAGRLVGFTSMVSLVMAAVYFRYASRIKHKKWLIATGFLLAAFIGTWMINLPPSVSMPWLVAPMVLRGLLLLFIALPVANLTFRVFDIDEYSHSYRFKNIVKQLTYSFSTATIIILEQHRVALHQTRLAETVNPYNPNFQSAYETLIGGFERMGHGLAQAKSLALVEISRLVTQQANFLGSLDGFYFIIGVALCASVIAIWQKRID
ncbi:major facilitator transporter [Caballeronia hypogeia]|uniref:Major facilitator transporter n=1 Tax=Caballeronia hypogeia TaxID=1777140 RepID=A0A158CPY1_9BURK|nr:MFS transporter [Caballeronia hypogeia]SAK84368.1 major facilitator transporter [Caballeronia hypogeia]